MKKKEIVTLALTTALLMTAHAVPASAAYAVPLFLILLNYHCFLV